MFCCLLYILCSRSRDAHFINIHAEECICPCNDRRSQHASENAPLPFLPLCLPVLSTTDRGLPNRSFVSVVYGSVIVACAQLTLFPIVIGAGVGAGTGDYYFNSKAVTKGDSK
jgi:hypothetical protein